ncbi:MAG: carbohydrate ABC transporter substrate-binding protein [Marinovum sp.]|nr:carbohydrate ABC transporter substrate-binding protein [Marinovum sp.]MBT6506760.1 carbohydrate ABC transporter substrate-binding protein [Marinovum sp.]MBT6532309.1 carbohydrate ABC transporter substrate-binding protein [Marinovum sp.]
MMKFLKSSLLSAAAVIVASQASAADLEVTHWWTSGGEAAAVAEFAKAFDATEHTWIDGAIAGSGGTARPIIISRILGGDPMHATQLNHGRQAEELVEAGLMLDLSDIAAEGGWADVVNPSRLLDSCTLDGKVYCVPVNIHSPQWLWLSHDAFAKAGLDVPSDWFEFVAAAPALREAGVVPLAMGQQAWQTDLAFGAIQVAVGGTDLYLDVLTNKNADAAASAEMTKVFEAYADARLLSVGSNVNDWNQATNLVITGQAGGQIHGDWAQGEFQVANQVAGEDYTCLPGLGVNEIIATGGDAFYFPKQDDPAIEAAQKELAQLMISKEVQVAFNLKKGSLPIRGDVDLSAANDCMKKGLSILAAGNVLPDGVNAFSADTAGQMADLMVEFWNDTSITVADAQARYVEIIATAD